MRAIILADELPKDVAGAETLIERHMEHRGEIGARDDSFNNTDKEGRTLIERNHYASDEIEGKLSNLIEAKNGVLTTWDERRTLYEQCMDLQIFYRETEQADAWMSKQEVRVTD